MAELDERFEMLGVAAHLCAVSPSHRHRDVSFIVSRVFPAIKHNQIKFAFDRSGYALAFWTWAFIDESTEARISRDNSAILDESEWNEGGNLWILDFVAPHGYVRNIIAFMRSQFVGCAKSVKASAYRNRDSASRTAVWRPLKTTYEQYCLNSLTYRLHRSSFARSFRQWKADQTRPSIAF